MLSFIEAKEIDAQGMTVTYNKKNYKGFFSNARINRDTLPDNWYAYDFREGDSGTICSLENNVAVNHYGTFLTNEKIELPKCGYISFACYDIFGNCTSIDDAEADYSFDEDVLDQLFN